MKRKENPVSLFLSEFLLDCEIRGLKEPSIKSYNQKLSYFFKHYEFTQSSVNQFILDCKKSGKHTATINSYLRALKAYGNFCHSDINIKFLKQEEIIKEIYTDEEIKRLIKKPETKNFNELKTWALVCFLVGTGCRISTALEITLEDLNLTSGSVLFRHLKNSTMQYFPLSKSLILVLKQYLLRRGEGTYLFCNQYGDKADLRTTQQQVADYNKARGVNKTSCHLFRRTFAANYIRNGGNPFYLQRLLSHKTLEMTRYYCNIYGTDLKIGLDNLSPLDRNIRQKIK